MKKPLVVFLVLAFGLSWAVALPLWFGGGLGSPLTTGMATLMMFTPTAGVLGAWALTRAPFRQWARETGLTLGERKGRTGRYVLGTWIGVPLLILAALVLSVAAGLMTLDLDGLGLLREAYESRGAPVPGDLGQVLTLQFVLGAVAGPLLNAIPALGEEWGWRGWLLPRLVAAKGVLPGLLLSGVIWGLWHAPLTLLGYNYPRLGSWAALYFVGFCVLAGVLFGWLRLRTGSVWPAVVAHGSLNAVAPGVLLLGDPASPPNEVLVGITGLVGWVLLAVVGALLLRFAPARPPAPPAPREPAPTTEPAV
ncbi:CAAX amino terminal protease self- immunity [Nonomuraea coxensis DSM 45129]|uniref:CAAX amino terminal protease self-immunity n=1 Tax=Nonomuraea coxensis DSM 45129 TaxID=1122611 RepID=A0ABX8U1L1_9ACTN|nr:CPBP family intramembrane glutamic endopeptidase [Nonomuraea coxensis]QYC40513.1 CAAX amino terminal protease self- immunity [Nonomuraea coxensis DSM 45129]